MVENGFSVTVPWDLLPLATTARQSRGVSWVAAAKIRVPGICINSSWEYWRPRVRQGVSRQMALNQPLSLEIISVGP